MILTAAWTELCQRLDAVGQDLVGGAFPDGPGDAARGYRYLASLLGFAMEWHIDRAEPAHPAFVVCEDDVLRWGAPNPDNLYLLRSRVAPGAAYRIWADVGGVAEVLVSVHQGEMQLGRSAVFAERSLSDLEVAPNGSLELFVGGDPRAGNWMPLDADAEYVLVRQYVGDWADDRTAVFHIERLGAEGSPPVPPSDAAVARGIAAAGDWVEATVRFWNDYSRSLREQLPVNELASPGHPAGGSGEVAYGMGAYELAADEALLIEGEPPKASHWGFQLLTHGWFECHDLRGMCSLNGRQVRIEPDGRYRLVVSATDPGVQNWLSTDGLTSGIVNYRYVRPSSLPAPQAGVVPIEDVPVLLPDAVRAFGPEDRRAQLDLRQRSMTERYR